MTKVSATPEVYHPPRRWHVGRHDRAVLVCRRRPPADWRRVPRHRWGGALRRKVAPLGAVTSSVTSKKSSTAKVAPAPHPAAEVMMIIKPE